MRRILCWLSAVFAAALAMPLSAGDGGNAPSLPPRGAVPAEAVERMVEGLPSAMRKRISDRPLEVAEEVADLILTYGQGDAIDAEGLETSVAADRARMRAREIGRLVAADLDADARVSREELAGLITRSAEGARGALRMTFDRADTDRDGLLTLAELATDAQVVALARVGERRAGDRLALLALDLDRDGSLTIEELVTAVAALAGRPAEEIARAL